MAEIKRTMIASLLIEQAGEMKHNRPTDLDFEDLIKTFKAMNIEKPYPIVNPTDISIDYSQCHLPHFESKHEGWMYYHDKIVSLEEAYELRLKGFSQPTHMAWYIEAKFYKSYPENHNTSSLKISLPTREQADCFLNGR